VTLPSDIQPKATEWLRPGRIPLGGPGSRCLWQLPFEENPIEEVTDETHRTPTILAFYGRVGGSPRSMRKARRRLAKCKHGVAGFSSEALSFHHFSLRKINQVHERCSCLLRASIEFQRFEPQGNHAPMRTRPVQHIWH
jgi:hypothetical protein